MSTWTRSAKKQLEDRTNKPDGGKNEDGRITEQCFTEVEKDKMVTSSLRVRPEAKLHAIEAEHATVTGWNQ